MSDNILLAHELERDHHRDENPASHVMCTFKVDIY